MSKQSPATFGSDSDLSVILRRATCADARALAELGATTFTESFGVLYAPQDLLAFLSESRSEDSYRRVLEDSSSATWLAVLPDGSAVGYVIAGRCKLPIDDLAPSAGEIQELYVRAGYQKHRLGTRLLTAALDWLDEQGRAPLYVGVWSRNLGAQRLYGRFGFSKIGEYEFAVGRQLDLEFILEQRRSPA